MIHPSFLGDIYAERLLFRISFLFSAFSEILYHRFPGICTITGIKMGTKKGTNSHKYPVKFMSS